MRRKKGLIATLITALVFACLYMQFVAPITIAIQPFSNIDQAIIDSVAKHLQNKYNGNIKILSPIELPSGAYYKPRNRYRADSIIAFLKREKSVEFDYILGITTKDISTTKGQHVDWGIFGLGYRPGPSCVVSTHRLKTTNQELFLNRLEKVALHEVGHNLGLPHCDNHNLCVMNDAHGTIKEVDENNHNVCRACEAKLFFNSLIFN